MKSRVFEMPRRRRDHARAMPESCRGDAAASNTVVEMPVLAPINWCEISELEHHLQAVRIATNRAVEVGRDLLARLKAGLPVQPYSEETLERELQRLNDAIDQAKQLDKVVPRVESLAKHF